MPLFNVFKRRLNHSAPVTSLTIGLKDSRPQNGAANCLAAPHLSATHKGQYQARMAETMDRDLEQEWATEDRMSPTVCSWSALCLHLVSWENFFDFNVVFWKNGKPRSVFISEANLSLNWKYAVKWSDDENIDIHQSMGKMSLYFWTLDFF